MTRKSISRIRYTLGEAVKKPAHVVRDTVEQTSDLLASSGELTFGKGLIGTIIALALGALCLLGVIAFHFPEYLTTPELRRQYSVDFLRQAMLVALLIAGGLSLANIILGFFPQAQPAGLCAGHQRGGAGWFRACRSATSRITRPTLAWTGSFSICSVRH
jgi:hypothetical protein